MDFQGVGCRSPSYLDSGIPFAIQSFFGAGEHPTPISYFGDFLANRGGVPDITKPVLPYAITYPEAPFH